MRGKVTEVEDENGYKRITPAYAGKSCVTVQKFRRLKDHPRLCGEKRISEDFSDADRGSPPPMRGKGSIESIIERRIRITPAYAGKSWDTSKF